MIHTPAPRRDAEAIPPVAEEKSTDPNSADAEAAGAEAPGPEPQEPSSRDRVVGSARRAVSEAAAATAILLDADAWPSSAAVHLLAGFSALLSAVEPREAAEATLADRMRRAELAGLPAPEREALAVGLERLERIPDGAPDEVDHRALTRQARALHGLALGVLRRNGVYRARWKWLAAGVAAVVVGALVAWGGGDAELAGEGAARGWLGRYYPELDFRGDPTVRYDEQIDFEWLDEPPADGVPNDSYTVRWDTCLELPVADQLQFRLGSDDGSRLFIDGEEVIDNWRDQAGNWASHEAELSEGVHHLRVEYYENGGDALAILNVTGPSGPVPSSMLRPPLVRGEEVACADD